jgi:phosphomannomutase/phosphoglucomutase
MLDRNPRKSMADLYRELPRTWGSPAMSPACADEVRYAVADRVLGAQGDAGARRAAGRPDDPRPRHRQRRQVTVEDGAGGLVRASSNKPELTVVVESPTSEARMRTMFEAIDRIRRESNQTI